MMSASRLPPYGKQRMAERERGLAPRWLCLALNWELGKAWPRVVIPRDLPTAGLNLRFAAGVDCIIATYPEEAHRVGPLFDRLQKFNPRDVRVCIVDEPTQFFTLKNAYGKHTDGITSVLAHVEQIGGRNAA